MEYSDEEVVAVVEKLYQTYRHHPADVAGTAMVIATSALIMNVFTKEMIAEGFMEYVESLGTSLGLDVTVTAIRSREGMH